jgi:mannose-6-phosphate isomerase-like protein (cupin superfamily)
MRSSAAFALGLCWLAGSAAAQDAPEFRRVVTGFSEDGRAVVVRDGTPEITTFASVPGYLIATVWRTPPDPVLPADGEEPRFPGGHLVPLPGGTHLVLVRWPSQAEMAAAMEENPGLVEDFMAELTVKVPDLAESISQENPDLHATASIDYVILISGSLVMELDDGAMVELGPGDVVVQNGTPHAWHNVGDEPAIMAAVLVGTPPQPAQ